MITKELVKEYELDGYVVTDSDFDDDDSDNYTYIQMVKELGHGVYDVIDWTVMEEYNIDDMYHETIHVIEELENNYEQVNECCEMYYIDGIDEIKSVCEGKDVYMVIAEILAEQRYL